MFTIKFYDGTKGNIYAQVDDFVSCTIKKDVTTYDTAEFILPSSFGGIEQLDKIDICTPQNGVDVVLFTGYVLGINGGLHTTIFTAYSEKYLLKRKLCLAPVASSLALSALISTITTGWNTATGDTLTSSVSPDFTVTADCNA